MQTCFLGFLFSTRKPTLSGDRHQKRLKQTLGASKILEISNEILLSKMHIFLNEKKLVQMSKKNEEDG